MDRDSVVAAARATVPDFLIGTVGGSTQRRHARIEETFRCWVGSECPVFDQMNADEQGVCWLRVPFE